MEARLKCWKNSRYIQVAATMVSHGGPSSIFVEAIVPTPTGPRRQIIGLVFYHNIGCIWALKSYHLGPCTLRALELDMNTKCWPDEEEQEIKK